MKFIIGDARNMKFKNNSFDIVYSSATIEHVGSHSNQLQFIKECFRVSRKHIFITTPNKFYPIEFHTKIPLLHFLPNKIFRKILLFLGLTFFAKEKNLNLLSEADLKRFCYRLKIQNYKIIRYKFLFFTSNLILHILKKL
jgi:ubiquinone/menaquinone biosynthesis C-methylase UbiE